MGWDNSNAEFAFGSNVSVTGEIVTFNTFGNVRANVYYGNGSQLTGVAASTAATVTNAAQPNITSTGILTTLKVSGNVDFYGSNVSLGNVSNLHITGGSAGYILKTDGTGNVSWAADSSALSSAVDEFTGTGSQTDFTLSVAPTNKKFTFVVLQGLMQPKSSYSVTGTTLSFSEAPPNGAFIEVTTLGIG
jgi:hypothetical protein